MKFYKILVFSALFFCLTFSATAQEPLLSATLSYPVVTGNNYGNKFTGVLDLGFQMRLVNTEPMHFGLSANAGYFTNSLEADQQSLNESALVFQPRLFAELDTPILFGFRPFLGLGYTFVRSEELGISTRTTATFTYGGLNFNSGLSLDIDDYWFLLLQYDTIKFKNGYAPTVDISDEGMALLKFGLGIRF